MNTLTDIMNQLEAKMQETLGKSLDTDQSEEKRTYYVGLSEAYNDAYCEVAQFVYAQLNLDKK